MLGTEYFNRHKLSSFLNLYYGYWQDKNVIDLFVDILLEENMIEILSCSGELRWSNVNKARLNPIFKKMEFKYIFDKYKDKIEHIDEVFNTKNKIILYQKKLDKFMSNIDTNFSSNKKSVININFNKKKSSKKNNRMKYKKHKKRRNRNKSFKKKFKQKIIKESNDKKQESNNNIDELKSDSDWTSESTNFKDDLESDSELKNNSTNAKEEVKYSNIIEIKSFTDKTKKYIINIDKMTCSCPAFKYNKTCKHLDYYLKNKKKFTIVN